MKNTIVLSMIKQLKCMASCLKFIEVSLH